MIVQEGIESFQFLREALDMIKPVHTDNDRHTLVPLLQRLDPFNDLGIFQRIDEFLWVDTNDELTDADQPILVLDLVRDFRAGATERG